MTANHHSLSSHEESLEKVNNPLTKANKENTSLDDRLQEVTNSLQGKENQANRLGKIKIRLKSSLQGSQEESENQIRQHGGLEQAKPVHTAQKEPNPAKSDGAATAWDHSGGANRKEYGKKEESLIFMIVNQARKLR